MESQKQILLEVPPSQMVGWVLTQKGGMQSYAATAIARACVDEQKWGHLRALVDAGYDIHFPSATFRGNNHGVSDAQPLLDHLIKQWHSSQALASMLGRLLDCGANPHAFNRLGFNAAGLMGYHFQFSGGNMPAFKPACQALLSQGVSFSDRCILAGSQAEGLFQGVVTLADLIRPTSAEMADWVASLASHKDLASTTPKLDGVSPSPRL